MPNDRIDYRYQKTFRFDLYTVTDLERMGNNTGRGLDDLVREGIDLLIDAHPEYLTSTGGVQTSMSKMMREIELREKGKKDLARAYPHKISDKENFRMICESAGFTLEEIEQEYYDSSSQINNRQGKAMLVGFLKGILFSAGDEGLDSTYIKEACSVFGFSTSQVQRYLRDVATPDRSGNSVKWTIKQQ